MRPLLLQRHAVATGDVDGDEGAGHRVEAGGVDDGVELERLVDGVDAGLGDRRDRVLAQVDEADVRQVEGGVVVGVEARPLGAERVVGRAQRLGRLGVVDDRADLVSDELGDDVVGRPVDQHVGEHADDREQLAGLPRRLEARPPLLLRQLQRAELEIGSPGMPPRDHFASSR